MVMSLSGRYRPGGEKRRDARYEETIRVDEVVINNVVCSPIVENEEFSFWGGHAR